MIVEFVIVLTWLQIKHFVADYLLQTSWIIRGKGYFSRGGGYVHAAVHTLGSLPAYVYAEVDIGKAGLLAGCEFVIHFAIDHLKAVQSRRCPLSSSTRAFWALHGADQLLHQLTYVGLMLAIFWGRTA